MIPTEIDLEQGVGAGEGDGNAPNLANSLVTRVCTGAEPIVGSVEPGKEEETLDSVEKTTTTKKKKAGRKPPKPPRPPRAVSLDAADEKLIQHISELAMLKRARVERMKALMKTKNSRPASSSSSFWPLVVTLLFCLIIVWQGIFSRSHSRGNFAGSPESSVGNGRMIQIQYLRNAFPSDSVSPSSASPRSLGVRGVMQGKRG
ncbi:uncharacterized protein LOC144715687 [Wolffia australiana]